VIVGAFDVRLYALVCAAFTLPIMLIAGALAVLIPSPLGSRRVAVLAGLLVMPILIILLALAVPSLGAVGVYLERAYGFLVLIDIQADGAAVTGARLRDALPALIGVPLAAWAAAWAWARWREAR
jgi:hypothetical protein